MAELGSPFRPENRTRGTLFALLIVPVAIVVYAIVFSFSWVLGIVFAGVPVGAVALYAWGSGGRVSFNAALRITLITVITLPLAFFAGFISLGPTYFAQALSRGVFFEALAEVMSLFDAASIVFPLLFMVTSGGAGLIAVYRIAYQQRRQLKVATTIIDPYA